MERLGVARVDRHVRRSVHGRVVESSDLDDHQIEPRPARRQVRAAVAAELARDGGVDVGPLEISAGNACTRRGCLQLGGIAHTLHLDCWGSRQSAIDRSAGWANCTRSVILSNTADQQGEPNTSKGDDREQYGLALTV